MANLFKKPSKKTAITAGITAAILAIVAVTGTSIYLKDKARTEAADFNSEQTTSTSQTTESGTQNGAVNNNQETANNNEQTGANNQGTETAQNGNGETTGTTADNTRTTGTATTGDTAGTRTTTGTTGTAAGTTTGTTASRTTDSIQETTITRNEEIQIPERKTAEGHYVGWTPMDITAELDNASKITAKSDEIEVVKTAKTKTGDNVVTAGEEFTYTIKVTNKSDRDLNKVNVTDKVPENTTYVSGSADNEGVEVKEQDKVIGIRWELDLKAGEEKEVNFKAKVNDNVTGTIENIAIANGIPTEPVKTAIVKSSKTSTITRNGQNVQEPAKVGDEITYTITVENTGDVEGKAEIKDIKLSELLENGMLKIKDDGKSEDNSKKLIEGTTENIPANGKVEISFTATVEKVNGKLINVANIGENEVEEDIDTLDYKLEKEVTSEDKDKNEKYDLDEIITYKVTVTNTGSTEIKNLEVKDPVSEEKTIIIDSIIVNGSESVEFSHKVTEEDIKEGKVVNTAITDDKSSNTVETKTEDPVEKVSMEKSVTGEDADKDGKYALGETITYKVTVTNIGNQTVSGVVVNDPVSEEKTRTTGTIKPNKSEDLTFTHVVTEADIAAKKVVNVATSDKGEPSNEVTTTTDDPVEKVSMVKSVTGEDADKDGKYALGETITYKVTVTNIGNQTVSGVVVNDPVSEEKTKTTGTIAVNGSEDLTFTHVVTEADIAAKKVVNVATSDKGEPSNEVTTTTDDPVEKVSMEKSVTGEDADKDGKYALGETITYKVTVTNIGNQTVSGVVVNDPVSEEKTKTTGTIAVNGHEDLTFTHVVTETDIAAKKVVNVATSDKGEPSNEVTTTTDDPVEKVSMEKSVTGEDADKDGKYALGETITYKVTVTNIGNKTVSGVVVNDPVSEEKTKTTGTIAVNGYEDLTFTHIVTEADIAAKKVVNVATSDKGEPSNEVTTTTDDPVEKVSMEKSVTGEDADKDGKYALGETITYKVTVTNIGNQTVSGVVVNDPVSEEKTKTTGTIAVNGHEDLTFTHVVTEADIAAKKVVNVATSDKGEPSNEVTTTTDDPVEKVSMEKSVTGEDADKDGKYALGETITYKVTVTNIGNQTVSGVVVNDPVSEEKTRTTGTIAVNGHEDLTFTHVVTEADIAAKKVVNVATSDKGEPSNEVTTNTDDPKKELTADKTVTSTAQRTDGKYKLGEKVSYQVVVTNIGNQTINGIKLSDKVNARTNIETVKRIDGRFEEDITLSTYTFTLSPNQSATFKYDYTVTEQDVADKKVENAVIAQADGTTNGTDTETVETIELVSREVSKEWKNIDENSIPDSVDVQLYANDVICGDVKTLTKGNWNATWNELEKYDANSRIINYTVKEVNIDLTNSTLTAIENNGINGDYKVTYSVDGDKTTITNTFRKPEITVTKSQNKEQNAIVKNGDSVTYTIIAENKGNKEGTVIIKDAKPENSINVSAWLDVNENGQKDSNETTVDLEQLNSEAGYTVELGEKDTATSKVVIGYTVTANGYAGNEISNTAYYKFDTTDEYIPANNTCTVKLEDDMQVVPTDTTTTQVNAKQNVILVLDYSGSMEGTRITSLRNTAKTFIHNFLSLNSENQVMIIKYAKNIVDTKNIYFTSNEETAKSLLNTTPDGGTNIDAGLTKANSYITSENASYTSVILMTDGLPSRYIDSYGNCSNMMGDGTEYTARTKIAADEAIASAASIKAKGAKLYSIGFGLNEIQGYSSYDWKLNKTHALEIIQSIATPSVTKEDGTIKKYWFDAANGTELNSAFETIQTSISEENDGNKIDLESNIGKIEITEGYTEGQNVQIYVNYVAGISTPVQTLSWNDFISAEKFGYMNNNVKTPYATYISGTNGKIVFDLGKYMENKNINKDSTVTIRFVDPNNTTKRSTPLNSLQVFTSIGNDIKDETINTNTVNKYEEELTLEQTVPNGSGEDNNKKDSKESKENKENNKTIESNKQEKIEAVDETQNKNSDNVDTNTSSNVEEKTNIKENRPKVVSQDKEDVSKNKETENDNAKTEDVENTEDSDNMQNQKTSSTEENSHEKSK